MHGSAEDYIAGRDADCCIVGGGPAGMMLGLLLARAGLAATVVEKHADFLRDFRGDTIHPSTLAVLADLGILDEFLALPHQKTEVLTAVIDGEVFPVADFRHLPGPAQYLAFAPQWHLLDFFARVGRRFPGFRLLMETEATDLVRGSGGVTGIVAQRGGERIEIRARLTVACDGRHSTVRERAGLTVEALGAPMDVLWFRLTRRSSDPGSSAGRLATGRLMFTIDRGDYWQCAYIIPKGGFDRVRTAGLDALRGEITAIAPFFADRTGEIASFDDVKLLVVAVDRLPRWHQPGLLVIGDAAHAMSPVGGVGINLAIQDAVAAANLLAGPLKAGSVDAAALARVEARRRLPVVLTQKMQVAVQNRVVGSVLRGGALRPPAVLRLLRAVPVLQRLPARLIGLGIRPERVETPAA